MTGRCCVDIEWDGKHLMKIIAYSEAGKYRAAVYLPLCAVVDQVRKEELRALAFDLKAARAIFELASIEADAAYEWIQGLVQEPPLQQ